MLVAELLPSGPRQRLQAGGTPSRGATAPKVGACWERPEHCAEWLTVDVVFVIGLAIEVAGAALLAAGQIRLVDLAIATRGAQSGEPTREAQQEAARFTVGFALLATGVIIQLAG